MFRHICRLPSSLSDASSGVYPEVIQSFNSALKEWICLSLSFFFLPCLTHGTHLMHSPRFLCAEHVICIFKCQAHENFGHTVQND